MMQNDSQDSGDVIGLLPTSIQRQLWSLGQMDPSGAYTNLLFVYRISGPLDLPVLERSFKAVMERHEALRVTFSLENGALVQVLRPEIPLPMSVADLMGEMHPDDRLAQLLLEEGDTPFQLETGPLIRIRVFRVSPHDHVLSITCHRLVLDAWAVRTLLSELRALYEAFIRGRPSPLPDLPMRYRDHLLRLAEGQEAEDGARRLACWRQQLQGISPLNLPVSRPGPRPLTAPCSALPLPVSPAVAEGLQAIGLREEATLFMASVAGFMALLHRYGGQDEVAVGITVAGRTRSELQGLLGCFTNTLVLRVGMADDLTFRQLVGRVRDAFRSALEHGDVPFDQLAGNRVQPGASPTPFLQVMLHEAPVEEDEQLGDARITRMPVELGGSQFDLAVSLPESLTSEGMRGWLRYNPDRVDHPTVDRLAHHFLALLDELIAAPDTPVSQLLFLAESDELRLREWNATEAHYDLGLPLHEWIAAQALRTPGAEAVRFRGEGVSYGELEERTNRLAQELVALGVGPETYVGVCMERSLELVVSLVAVLKAGGAYVPLDPEYPAARLEAMMEDASPAVILVQERLKTRLPATQTRVLAVDAEWWRIAAQRTSEAPAVEVGPHNPAYAIFTSGSTGRPKGVVNEHRGIVNRLLWMRETFELGVGDRVLQKTPYSFDVSGWEFFWPLMTGATLVMAEPGGHRDPGYLVDTIVSEGITAIHFVPSMLQAFLTVSVERCGSLRRIFSSGEALGADVAEQIMARLPQAELFNLYGPTEAAIEVTWWRCERGWNEARVPIGRPVANTRIHILDRHGRPTPLGVPGELHIAGVQVARGYLGQPELTAERFVADPFAAGAGERMYRTGDLAYWRWDGAIQFLGRLDHQVKVRGFRIELGEIEVRLREMEEVADCVVTAWGAEDGDQRLAAYLVFEAGCSLGMVELRRRLSETLPDYMVPGWVVPLEALPLTSSGKVDRKSLPDPLEGSLPTERGYEAPVGEVEETIARIWQELLGVERVGRHDNFFELGGHSLLAMRVLARLRSKGLELPMPLLMGGGTPASLASAMESVAVDEVFEV